MIIINKAMQIPFEDKVEYLVENGECLLEAQRSPDYVTYVETLYANTLLREGNVEVHNTEEWPQSPAPVNTPPAGYSTSESDFTYEYTTAEQEFTQELAEWVTNVNLPAQEELFQEVPAYYPPKTPLGHGLAMNETPIDFEAVKRWEEETLAKPQIAGPDLYGEEFELTPEEMRKWRKKNNK